MQKGGYVMKKLTAFIMILVLLTSHPAAFATETAFNENEYEAQVARILKDYASDPEAAEAALLALDTELISEPVSVTYSQNPNSRGTSPTDYTLTVTSFKRSNSTVHYLQWILEVHTGELFPGPLDFVSMEWDTAYASYYASSGDGTASTVQGRDTGIVLFNLEDDNLSAGEYSYGTVRVEPVVDGWMEFGSKYVHTYTSLLLAGSASYSFQPSATLLANGIPALGLTYTKGYTVTIDAQTNQWQIWADNAVNIY